MAPANKHTGEDKLITRISLLLWAGIATVSGLSSSADMVRAAELKVLASVALTSALNELAPVYDKATTWQEPRFR